MDYATAPCARCTRYKKQTKKQRKKLSKEDAMEIFAFSSAIYLAVLVLFASSNSNNNSIEIANQKNVCLSEPIELHFNDEPEIDWSKTIRAHRVDKKTHTVALSNQNYSEVGTVSIDSSDEDPLSYLYETESIFTEESSIYYSSQAIELSELDFALLCKFVLHEVGNNSDFYIGNTDISLMQQCIAATVTNRISSAKFSDTTVSQTLMSSGFLGGIPGISMNTKEDLIKYLFRIDSLDDLSTCLEDFNSNSYYDRVKTNTMEVISGSSIVPNDLIFEMGWKMYDANGQLITDLSIVQKRMEKECGKIEIFYHSISKEDYVCIFARKIW